ncbi:D-lactate dehydrogenase [Devosia sp. ZB163]|uniref:D-lactate dehydrogenase n=1 Tax=Devosia sp. ZB163 TaxID=3025938 RepID=UPI00235F17E7|nr:D-lactate dehydrogenase [Devosia sp. ZB163]MDC9824732.1 D-lactate dehydrogenase [Devosia sp. ZB163]
MPENQLVDELRAAVGRRYLLTGSKSTERYRRGFRSGEGDAVAVAKPGTLLELWRVLEATVRHDAIVIMQAANTGLTEGSTPSGHYDRPVVVVNTLRLSGIQLLDGGKQIVSFPGGTLDRLERLLKPLGRLPHSVIGSSCLGASIVGGVCNNSGGSLVQRGPAYTELSLFAQIGADGQLELVNHLGIDLGTTPEEILDRLQSGSYAPEDVRHNVGLASDSEYAQRVRQVDEPTAARFNADPRRLHEAAGCGGKLAVFAVRLDTFEKAGAEQVFYIGTNDVAVLTQLRRELLALESLPVAGEYMHRDMFDVARRYGKDTFLVIQRFGTDVMPTFFNMKGRADATLNKLPLLPQQFSDRVLQGLSRFFPEHLPKRMLEYRDRYEHHLMLRMSGDGIAEAESLLERLFATAEGGYFRCTPREGAQAFLHRFAAAGAAIRYSLLHEKDTGGLLALDIALRRNDPDWYEHLPAEIDDKLALKLYYGHFLCHVLHQDYVLKKGADAHAVKHAMLEQLDRRGAQYPAEHNVGHVYEAKAEQRDFYRSLDPTNSFNPGIGGDTKHRHYAGEPEHTH